ncbi:diaminopropionate ammonia-lyase [Ruicaihuangia caeni]|uniref:diaminopropionate ammonia-lyase n=1 Tax=Ruicaihuangia caeni TaxID=3042517 RepID=UPI0033905739
MTHQVFVNPRAAERLAPAPSIAPMPIDFHRTMPGYEPTPLRELPALAQRLGVARVYVKDESSRMGLPSFKLLGASWASSRAVAREWIGTDELLSPEQIRERIPQPHAHRLVAATDGNHGRGIAYMSRLFGVACTIYVPAGTADSRIRDIESEGATVVVVDGTYDDAIARSAEDADDRTLVVSDTSWEGYMEIPASVIDGYSTLFAEVDDAVSSRGLPEPTVVAMQAGVGAFAAAALRHYRASTRENAPRTVIVEPTSANSLLVSAQHGEPTEVPGPHPSTMAGLNCGLPSILAWNDIVVAADTFVAVEDAAAEEAMRALAGAGVVSGESGAAGLAGLIEIAEHGTAQERSAVGLHPDAVVLLVNTEGATDPENYERVVGRRPETLAATAAV